MACVYVIANKVNGKVYVGSSQRPFETRKKEHIYQLSTERHGNEHLTRAWAKYGPDNFHFELLEEMEDAQLMLERESYWLDYFATLLGHENIYNEAPVRGSVYGKKKPISDQGKQNMSDAAKKRFLENPELYEVLRVRREHANESKRANGTKPTFTDEQKKAAGERLQRGLIEKGIDRSAINSKLWVGFLSPEGVEYKNIFNLNKFCREHGLCMSAMSFVGNGKAKQHKGWTKLKEE